MNSFDNIYILFKIRNPVLIEMWYSIDRILDLEMESAVILVVYDMHISISYKDKLYSLCIESRIIIKSLNLDIICNLVVNRGTFLMRILSFVKGMASYL